MIECLFTSIVIYLCICTHMHTHAHTHTHEHGRTDTQTHKRTHADTHACMYARTHARTYARTDEQADRRTHSIRVTLLTHVRRGMSHMWMSHGTKMTQAGLGKVIVGWDQGCLGMLLGCLHPPPPSSSFYPFSVTAGGVHAICRTHCNFASVGITPPYPWFLPYMFWTDYSKIPAHARGRLRSCLIAINVFVYGVVGVCIYMCIR